MNAFGLDQLFRAVKDLCFPPACLACDRRLPEAEPPLFCPDCLAALRFPESPLCSCCGRTFSAAAGGDHLCGACLQDPPFHRVRAVFFYTPEVARAIHSWKYGRTMAGLATFAYFFRRRRAALNLATPDLIIPVPLHPSRLRQRGFNQAQLLSLALFPEQSQKVKLQLMQRLRPTPPQTGLSGEKRRLNVKGAFQVDAPEQVAGRRVLLIDDVLTTGATIGECARVLSRAGATEVQALTLARVID
jgi:ComF family protein